MNILNKIINFFNNNNDKCEGDCPKVPYANIVFSESQKKSIEMKGGYKSYEEIPDYIGINQADEIRDFQITLLKLAGHALFFNRENNMSLLHNVYLCCIITLPIILLALVFKRLIINFFYRFIHYNFLYYRESYYFAKFKYLIWRISYKKKFYTNYFGKKEKGKQKIDYNLSMFVGKNPPKVVPLSPSLSVYAPSFDSLKSIIFRLFSIILFLHLIIFSFFFLYCTYMPISNLCFYDIILFYFSGFGLFILIFTIIGFLWHLDFGLRHYYLYKKSFILRYFLVLSIAIEILLLLLSFEILVNYSIFIEGMEHIICNIYYSYSPPMGDVIHRMNYISTYKDILERVAFKDIYLAVFEVKDFFSFKKFVFNNVYFLNFYLNS